MGDAASCAAAGQTTPNGYYNIERMLKAVSSRGGRIGVCGSCMDARGLKSEALAQGAHRSSMEELYIQRHSIYPPPFAKDAPTSAWPPSARGWILPVPHASSKWRTARIPGPFGARQE